jgi:hypothetical protein
MPASPSAIIARHNNLGVGVGDHLVNGSVVNGYIWIELGPKPAVFFPDEHDCIFKGEGTLRWCVDDAQFQQGLGQLTELGRAIVNTLWKLGVYEIWSDQPNLRLRVQRQEQWDTVSEVAKEMFLATLIDNFFGHYYGTFFPNTVAPRH